MTIQFFDRQDQKNPLNGKSVGEEGVLIRTLDSLLDRTPFFCELLGENGLTLLIGVGDVGCVQYSTKNDGSAPNLMALVNSEIPQDEIQDQMEFLIGGTLTPVSKRYALPFFKIKEIAKYFQQTGEPSPAVRWEEI